MPDIWLDSLYYVCCIIIRLLMHYLHGRSFVETYFSCYLLQCFTLQSRHLLPVDLLDHFMIFIHHFSLYWLIIRKLLTEVSNLITIQITMYINHFHTVFSWYINAIIAEVQTIDIMMVWQKKIHLSANSLLLVKWIFTLLIAFKRSTGIWVNWVKHSTSSNDNI